MSLNRTRIALALLAGGFGLVAAGCGVTSIDRQDVAMGITPIEQYPLRTVARPQGILLAPRAGGLSRWPGVSSRPGKDTPSWDSVVQR